jgi:hypothetical protein
MQEENSIACFLNKNIFFCYEKHLLMRKKKLFFLFEQEKLDNLEQEKPDNQARKNSIARF